jgi:hypothetical protein
METALHPAAMQTVEYTRKAGRQLTYRIRADDLARYEVHIGDKELLRGRDTLSRAGGIAGATSAGLPAPSLKRNARSRASR